MTHISNSKQTLVKEKENTEEKKWNAKSGQTHTDFWKRDLNTFLLILGMILTLLLAMSKEGNKKSIHLKITKNSIDFLYKKTMNC